MYNANASYEENYNLGPSSFFLKKNKFPVLRYIGTPRFNFLGKDLFIPFGIPAGPLLNAAYVQRALEAGFCLPTYKTVRSRSFASHPFPNVLRVENVKLDAGRENRVRASFFEKPDYEVASHGGDLSITNSFGVPSKDPRIWIDDFAKIEPSFGQAVALSFQATRDADGIKRLLDDVLITARLASSCSEILEVNLSCPNENGEPIFRNLENSVAVLAAIRQVFPRGKLIAKIGVMDAKTTFEFVSATLPFLDAISAINTLSAKILSREGQVILGSGQDHGGVCGSAILEAGLTMVKQLSNARKQLKKDAESLAIIGVGGVRCASHFNAYMEAGAQVVQAATGAMWNLDLAAEIAKSFGVTFNEESRTC